MLPKQINRLVSSLGILVFSSILPVTAFSQDVSIEPDAGGAVILNGDVQLPGIAATGLNSNGVCYDAANGQLTNCDMSIVGPEGPQGIAGADGVIGPIGPAGPQGIAGADGAIGPIGPAGPQGIAGADGAIGPIGPAGPQGIAGADGAIGPIGPAGPQGIAGADGAIGPIGPAGPQGIAGADGAIGPIGPAGPKGDVGADGAIGPIGPAGPQGIAGADGAIGPIGPAGPKGDVGADGAIGPIGPAGALGPQGPMGLPGPTGPEGPQGPAGTSIVDGSTTGDVLTWDGNNWIAQQPAAPSSASSMQPFNTVNYIIALQGTFPSRNSANPFIAEIIMFGGNFAPRSWAFCDGQLLPIAQNQALFSLLGTTYGGDGRTNFGLPDLRGRVAIHAGTGPGLSQKRLGQKGGSEAHIHN